MDAPESARDAFLRAFRWTHGHADFAGVFRDPKVLATLGPALAAPFVGAGITAVVALEARGFVLGALCAQRLGVGIVLARKPGSIHPGDKVEVTSAPDWRGREVPISIARILDAQDKVLLVDDWIETGSQARAVKAAVEACGAELTGTSVVVDDTTAAVRAELNVIAMVRSDELGVP
jgi:adenine phosphoribosyltransferase